MTQLNIRFSTSRTCDWQSANAARWWSRPGLEDLSRDERQAIEARFWTYVKKTSTCWLWTGGVCRGYGQFHLTRDRTGRCLNVRTNRFAWMLAHGSIPEGLDVCHHCDVPLCCNVQHFFLGTARDNLQDASQKGRLGGPRNRTLTLDDRLAIYHTPATYGSGVALARQYGVTKACITIIRSGRFIGSGVWFGTKDPAGTVHNFRASDHRPSEFVGAKGRGPMRDGMDLGLRDGRI